MLRVTFHKDENPPRLKLEGKLVGAWVAEVETLWRSSATPGSSGNPRQELLVDLSAVTCVDDAGWKLLKALHASGAGFRAEGVKMKALVEEMQHPSAAEKGQREQ